MWFRLALAAPLVLAGALAVTAPVMTAPASAAQALAAPAARTPPAPPTKPAVAAKLAATGREAASPARERQRACGAEWRALSPADKTAKGPTWPQFYSRCVKRLKSGKP